MLYKVVISLGLSFTFVIAAFANPNFTQVSFQTIDKLIVVQATIKGQSGNFIIDTGVSDIVLNKKYFPNLICRKGNKDLHGITGQATQAEIARVKIQLGDFIKKMDAELLDLQVLEQNKNLKLLGLIGIHFFKSCALSIDYPNQKIGVYQLDKMGECLASTLASTPDITLSFGLRGHLVCVNAQLNGYELELGLDTGAEVNLLDLQKRVAFEDQLGNIKGDNLVGLNGKRRSVPSIELANLNVGGFICQPMKTFVFSLSELNRGIRGSIIHGLLGYEFLNQFRVIINFKKREVYLWSVRPDVVSLN